MATEVTTNETEAQKNLAEAKKNLDEARRKYAEAKKAAQKRKKKGKEIIRKSNDLDDAHLCTKSNLWHALFMDHVGAFSAFDATMDAAFAANWFQRTELFEAHPSDEAMQDEMIIKSNAVEQKVKALLLITDSVEYFVKRAFPNKPRKLHEFGFELLRIEVTNYVPHLALVCYTMQLLIADHLTELTTAGMPATLPTDLETATTALALAERQHEYSKRLRIRASTTRVEMFNSLWDTHIMVKKAAAIIFSQQPEVAGQFG